jgi:hypothetical protein
MIHYFENDDDDYRLAHKRIMDYKEKFGGEISVPILYFFLL